MSSQVRLVSVAHEMRCMNFDRIQQNHDQVQMDYDGITDLEAA